jgi:hypothetical protein
MKRRVSTRRNFSELGMVEVQYEASSEEHLGVSNRNLKRVELDGAVPLYIGKYRIYSVL